MKNVLNNITAIEVGLIAALLAVAGIAAMQGIAMLKVKQPAPFDYAQCDTIGSNILDIDSHHDWIKTPEGRWCAVAE